MQQQTRDPGPPTQLADLYEAIETVHAARKRFLMLDDPAAAQSAEQMMNQLVTELHARLGFSPIDRPPDR